MKAGGVINIGGIYPHQRIVAGCGGVVSVRFVTSFSIPFSGLGSTIYKKNTNDNWNMMLSACSAVVKCKFSRGWKPLRPNDRFMTLMGPS